MSRFLRALLGDAVPLSWAEAHRSALAALFGLGFTAACAWMLRLDAAAPLLLTPIAASTVILFAIPHSPLAQPWSFAGGSTLAALIGLICALVLPSPLWAGILAVPLAIWLMARLACLHPPAGAQALAFALAGRSLLEQGWRHALWPLVLNVGGMLVAAFVANNLLPGRRYPFRAERTATHATRDPEPLARLGIRHEDLRHAMTKMDTFLDIAEADLVSVYALATQHAFQRTTQLTCGDLMSRDVISVEFATDLEEAWHSLRDHHFKALPVIDRARRVIGIVTQADFIRHAEGVAGEGALERLKRLLRRTPGPNSDKAEVVGQIMSQPVRSVMASAPLSDALAVLATAGKHHVPVLDEDRRLVGMLTQSDLLAALYARLAIQPANALSAG